MTIIPNRVDFNSLVNFYLEDREIDYAGRKFFEDLVDTFPLCAKYWLVYIEQEV